MVSCERGGRGAGARTRVGGCCGGRLAGGRPHVYAAAAAGVGAPFRFAAALRSRSLENTPPPGAQSSLAKRHICNCRPRTAGGQASGGRPRYQAAAARAPGRRGQGTGPPRPSHAAAGQPAAPAGGWPRPPLSGRPASTGGPRCRGGAPWCRRGWHSPCARRSTSLGWGGSGAGERAGAAELSSRWRRLRRGA
jgi:hypothetical protein